MIVLRYSFNIQLPYTDSLMWKRENFLWQWHHRIRDLRQNCVFAFYFWKRLFSLRNCVLLCAKKLFYQFNNGKILNDGLYIISGKKYSFLLGQTFPRGTFSHRFFAHWAGHFPLTASLVLKSTIFKFIWAMAKIILAKNSIIAVIVNKIQPISLWRSLESVNRYKSIQILKFLSGLKIVDFFYPWH